MVRKRPDLAWYSGESRKQGLPTPRCPLAHAELCPRYYESLDALGRAGGFTNISSERSAALERKWKAFKSVIAEEEPSISGRDEGVFTVDHFCPEVSYDAYGYFASNMFEYADDDDRGYAYKAYEREEITEQFDPRWASIRPRHYTECRRTPIHATFTAGKPSKAARRARRSEPEAPVAGVRSRRFHLHLLRPKAARRGASSGSQGVGQGRGLGRPRQPFHRLCKMQSRKIRL